MTRGCYGTEARRSRKALTSPVFYTASPVYFKVVDTSKLNHDENTQLPVNDSSTSRKTRMVATNADV